MELLFLLAILTDISSLEYLVAFCQQFFMELIKEMMEIMFSNTQQIEQIFNKVDIKWLEYVYHLLLEFLQESFSESFSKYATTTNSKTNSEMLKYLDQIFHHQSILSNGKKRDLFVSWIILLIHYYNLCEIKMKKKV